MGESPRILREAERGARAPSWKLWRMGLLLRGAATIRRKLILLHTIFSLGMAAVLLVALRQPIQELLAEEELRECVLAVEAISAGQGGHVGGQGSADKQPVFSVPGVEIIRGDAERIGLSAELAERARAEPGRTVTTARDDPRPLAARFDAAAGEFLAAIVRSPQARSAINRVYLLMTLSLLGVYAVIALMLEVLVLPRQVYGPIARLRAADEAVQGGRREDELIPDSMMPSDELGDIMRSRNQSITALRRQEHALAEALGRLEEVASELKRKNHLLETARRNLADQDRLASLGMMSAGIAHELNTPLAVLKGSVEQLAGGGGAVDPERAALMLRVVNRLERLSESLLDFARVRPTKLDDVAIAQVVEEAWTLVKLDRGARSAELQNRVGEGIRVLGDGDRLTQVFVNLLRNAVDAMEDLPVGAERRVVVEASVASREGRDWASITVTDSGPGIEPELFPRLFEPFASTRLDAQGTGLGLAVAEGIIREHGGLMLARNAAEEVGGAKAGVGGSGAGGAVFEVMLPIGGPASAPNLFGPDVRGGVAAAAMLGGPSGGGVSAV